MCGGGKNLEAPLALGSSSPCFSEPILDAVLRHVLSK